LVVLGFELRASYLLAQVLCLLSYNFNPFSLAILEIESHFCLRQAWTAILVFYSSHHHWNDRCVPPHLDFIGLDWDLLTYLTRLAWNHNFPDLSLFSS
jgi:hypothetical protein